MKTCIKWALGAWCLFIVLCIIGTQSLIWGLLVGIGLPCLPFLLVAWISGLQKESDRREKNTIYVQHLKDRRGPTHDEIMQEHHRKTRDWW